MSDLKIDTWKLRECGASLQFVAQEFSSAEAIAENYAETIGHPGLADKVNDFADNWSVTREEMLGSIQKLAEAATQAGEIFEEIDIELAAALRGES
jgi:hypothetical protein